MKKSDLKHAMKRLGEFGKLFVDYKGCPRGARGRAFMPIEQEVFAMAPVTDVDGGVWIPVNEDALRELVERYTEGYAALKNEADRDSEPTCELVKRLEESDGVETIKAEPYQDVQIEVNGPAVVLIVTD